MDHGAAGIEAVQGVGDQVQHDLLDFLSVHGGDDRRRVREFDAFFAVLAQVPHHVDHALDQFGQVGVVLLHVAHPREIQQFLGDAFAAKGFLLDLAQVVPQDFDFRILFCRPVFRRPPG